MLDVDVHHGDVMGLHAHSFGHCYRSGGYYSMDHLWVDGLFSYYFSTGDPFAKEDLDGIREMALEEIQVRPFAEDNLRNFVLGITMNLIFFESTGDRRHLETALRVARDLMADQAEEGYFPGGGRIWAEQHREGEAFPGESRGPSTLSELHTMEALRRLHEQSGADDVRISFLRLVRWFVRYNLHPAGDAVRLFAMPKGEPSPRGQSMFRSGDFFCLSSLAYAYRLTGERDFARVGAWILRNLAETQLGKQDHPMWEGIWFEHAGVASADGVRTVPQGIHDESAVFNYITPLSASFSLYKTREVLWAIQEAGVVKELEMEA